MLHIKFETSEPSSFEEDFIFFYVFLYFKHRTRWGGVSLDPRPLFDQTCFSMYFYTSNTGPIGAGSVWTPDIYLIKLGRCCTFHCLPLADSI